VLRAARFDADSHPTATQQLLNSRSTELKAHFSEQLQSVNEMTGTVAEAVSSLEVQQTQQTDQIGAKIDAQTVSRSWEQRCKKLRRELDLTNLALETRRLKFEDLLKDNNILTKERDELQAKVSGLTEQLTKTGNERDELRTKVLELTERDNGPSKQEWKELIGSVNKIQEGIDDRFHRSTEQLDEVTTTIHDAIKKVATDTNNSAADAQNKLSEQGAFNTSTLLQLTEAQRTRSQRDDLTTTTISQLVGANRSLTETNANLGGTNAYLAATNGGFTETNKMLAKSNLVSNLGTALGILAAGQQAHQLEATHRENAELSYEKRTLELDNDELAEELRRSRRRRVDPPVGGDFHLIKIWTGSEEKSFTDLHVSVQQAVRTWSDGHVLGAEWFAKAQKSIRFCMRNERQERCKVPPSGTDKVACSQCVGGKTFCIRRRAEDDETLCLFPLHTDERREASVDDVTFWRMNARKRTPPGFHSKKLYP
jgi:hypothetical protein